MASGSWTIDVVLTVEQAAALLQLTPATVRRFASAGRVPGIKLGRRWRFDETVLSDWLKSRALENLKSWPSVVEKAPRIGRSAFSSLDARLESLLAQPTEPLPNSSKRP